MKSKDLVVGRSYNFRKFPHKQNFFFSGIDKDVDVEGTAYCFTCTDGSSFIMGEEELFVIEEVNIYKDL